MTRYTHQDYDIHSSLHEQVQPVLVLLPRADGGSTEQLFAGVFGGQRIVSVLLQVGASDDSHQLITVIHNGQLTCGAPTGLWSQPERHKWERLFGKCVW